MIRRLLLHMVIGIASPYYHRDYSQHQRKVGSIRFSTEMLIRNAGSVGAETQINESYGSPNARSSFTRSTSNNLYETNKQRKIYDLIYVQSFKAKLNFCTFQFKSFLVSFLYSRNLTHTMCFCLSYDDIIIKFNSRRNISNWKSNCHQ